VGLETRGDVEQPLRKCPFEPSANQEPKGVRPSIGELVGKYATIKLTGGQKRVLDSVTVNVDFDDVRTGSDGAPPPPGPAASMAGGKNVRHQSASWTNKTRGFSSERKKVDRVERGEGGDDSVKRAREIAHHLADVAGPYVDDRRRGSLPKLAAKLAQHARRKVHRGHSDAEGSQMNRVQARATSDIEDPVAGVKEFREMSPQGPTHPSVALKETVVVTRDRVVRRRYAPLV
jgi:hypothetical protein